MNVRTAFLFILRFMQMRDKKFLIKIGGYYTANMRDISPY